MVDLFLLGLVLVLMGFGAVVVSMLEGSRDEGVEVKGGGVVMIGPIPIIFGSDARWASFALVLAIVLMRLVFLMGWA